MYKYTLENLRKAAKSEKGRELFEKYKKIYEEKYQNTPIPPYDYALVKDFYRTGDRKKHQDIYYNLRNRLTVLQLLAYCDDEYIEPLANIIYNICNESTWVLPAHNYIEKEGIFDLYTLDINSTETGFFLAETAYILGDKLSSDIRNRIKVALEEKIVKIFENRVFRWEGEQNSNWASVCSCGIGIVYLYAFAERFSRVEERIINAMKNYLTGITQDGYCSEGMAYWYYGFGFFSFFFDVYTQLTEKRPELLESEKVKNTLDYFSKARLDENFFLQYSDGGYGDKSAYPAMTLYGIKSLFVDRFSLPEGLNTDPTEKAHTATLLYGACNFASEKQSKNEVEHFFGDAEVYICKTKGYSFTAKCGHNAELHNHLDVGSFHLVKNQKQIFADLGAGEYTKNYFGHDNDLENGSYSLKVFVRSSFAHSIPIVGKKGQKIGREFCGRVIEASENRCAFDISGAYDGAEGLTVEYELFDEEIKIRYSAKRAEGGLTLRFVTKELPEITEKKTTVLSSSITSEEGIIPVLSEWHYSNHRATPTVAYTLDYVLEGEEELSASFTVRI